ncbi:MAG: hypothetical protein HY842_05710 [Bacteroidetes bacterium]|nr:hypothetical protein [Bacteroidota bacterium]
MYWLFRFAGLFSESAAKVAIFQARTDFSASFEFHLLFQVLPKTLLLPAFLKGLRI